MKVILSFIVVLMLSACAIPDVRNEYQGQNAGRIAIGIGATKKTNYSSYSLQFRKVGSNEDAQHFVYFQNNMFSAQKRDYDDSDENGVVQSFKLQPGDYEIFNFDIFLNGGTVQRTFKSKKDFSIPFTVRSNETIYLGNYQANLIKGKNVFGMQIPAGAVFVITNREKADIDLIKKRIPDISFGSVSNATPTAMSVANPFFVEKVENEELPE